MQEYQYDLYQLYYILILRSVMNNSNDKAKISAPNVSMPAGGGALRSISEPFKAQSFTGAGSLTIPLPLPEARGFAPQISLSYNSGSGNGLFGLGFSVALPSIARKTSNGIPRYDDSDIFTLNGSELIPKYTDCPQGWVQSAYNYDQGGTTWQIIAYRPRIEGDFALIEQWTDSSSLLSHWKVVSADNITSMYGISDNGRIYNPEHPQQIFEWLIENSVDPHGNKIIYQYKAGDRINIPETVFNTGRDDTSERYPDTIRYGNYFTTENDKPQENFAFEVVFDYGQINKDNPDAAPTTWTARPDPFSSYKSGFEIRITRLCYGIYIRHHFKEENNNIPFTTTALLTEYDTTSFSGISIIKRIINRGYRSTAQQPLWIADTPATELHYHTFDPLSASWQLLEADAPGYLNSGGFIPVDLDGIGIDGLLYSNDTFTGYLEPLGNGRYAPMRELQHFPLFRDLQPGQVSLTSLEGNHVLDLTIINGVSNGFFAQQEQDGWQTFQPFSSFPEEYLSPEKELADLSGTGRTDLLFVEGSQLKHYASKGKSGFAEAAYTFKPPRFPHTTQDGAQELTGFSDFIGDGLSHRFCLRNGSLTVWPCLGHGNFGEAISLSNAPLIDGPFDASRIFLIDADGSGTTDIIYCYPGFARIWFNNNGNTFSPPIEVIFPASYSVITAITAGDVNGYGTTALIFTVADPGVKHWYYDFSNKQKPYLLQCIDNGVGGLSSLTYTTSVLEQLQDKQQGRIWPTRLPLAVSLVSESSVTDQLTGAVYTQRYRYHDGYFDPVEREFRGFGFVETWDSETYEAFQATAITYPGPTVMPQEELWMPPVYTRSWFITGAYEQTPVICAQYETEFYNGDTQQWHIPIFELDSAWDSQDAFSKRQAYASLAGALIRTEVYAEDNTPLAAHPYTVSMSGMQVRLVQPRRASPYCSVMPLQVNSLNYTYDRDPTDPLISQNLVLTMDIYGNPLYSASISFPRRDNPEKVIYPEQQQLRIVINDNNYINKTNNNMADPNVFWQYLGLNWQSRSYELGNIATPPDSPFTQADLSEQAAIALQHPLQPSESRPATAWSRLLSWSRSVYWDDQTTNSTLPYGEVNELALLHHTETVVLSPWEVTNSFGDKVTNDMLTTLCGYELSDGYWWNYGLMQQYNWNDEQFYTPSCTKATIAGNPGNTTLDENGFNGSTSVLYDPYWMMIIQTSSALSEDICIDANYEYDYQSLSPVKSTDANGNISEVLCDPLGQVIATSVYGQVNGTDTGDLPLSQYTIQQDATFDDVIADPAKYLQGATSYFYYDFFAWKSRKQPVNAIDITRNIHVQDMAAAAGFSQELEMPISIAYSNGLGAMLQNKAKTTPGAIALQAVDSNIIHPSYGTSAQDRWLVSGRTVYNNKAMPVEQYQSYFSATPYFEDQQQIIDQKLVPPPTVTHYDPAGRVIRTDTPKGFFSKTVYTSWETSAYDVNDTLPDSPYYQWFVANYPDDPEQWQVAELAALNAALPCYNTPAKVVTDNLGNAIRTIACNLGGITAASIPADIAYPLSSQQAWDALLTAGYLAKKEPSDSTAWITPAFQPYQPGFHAVFTAQFSNQLEDYLAQSCLTTLSVYDILGRLLYNADPRLFLKMVREETVLFNVRNDYSMDGQVLQSESADAGIRLALTNMAGNAVATWDSRNFYAQNKYDNLQRLLSTYISGGDGQAPLANWVQLTVYGETAPDATDYNLVGKPWKDFDESGLSVIEAYSLGGGALRGKTYLRPDYKTEANWTTQAQQDILNTTCYTRSTLYNAPGQAIAEIQPDGSIQAYTYDINGLLLSSSQKVYNPALDTALPWQTVISNITYDATGKRQRVTNGNGVTAAYTYDALTQQLLRSCTTRAIMNDQEDTVLQDLYYTYDPAGHTISVLDNSNAVTFYNNQEVAPRNTYAYDPLYRIITAQGRTLPGLNLPEGGSQAKNSNGFPRIATISDQQQLENYTQRFSYDSGNNLVLKRHTAASGNWTQTMMIATTNNQLHTIYTGNPSHIPAGLPQFSYDGNGNMAVLNPGSTARVSWNYLNHMANVVSIAREVTDPETDTTYTLNDAEYYQYNTSGNRVRKVTERVVQGGTKIEYTEKIYLGNYQQSRTWSSPVNTIPDAPAPPVTEKHTLIVKDGNAPALITHIWVTVPSIQTAIKAGDVQYRYQLCDPLDSVTMEVNEKAILLSYEQYYVYGGTAFTLAENQLEAGSKELRFCGKERDTVTGLYYYGARYYAEWLCRWMSPDPAGQVDGLNLYEYVRSNPVNYNDPTGTTLKRDRGNAGIKTTEPKAKKAATAAQIRTTEVTELIMNGLAAKGYVYNRVGGQSEGTYATEPEIQKPRKNTNEAQNVARHLANYLLSRQPSMKEVQIGISKEDKNTIYVASNEGKKALMSLLKDKKTLKDFSKIQLKKVKLPPLEKKLNSKGEPIGPTAIDKSKKYLLEKQFGHSKKLRNTDSIGAYKDYKIEIVHGVNGKHAETKILDQIAPGSLEFIGGTKRPCLCCFLNYLIKNVDPSVYNAHIGAFWASANAAKSLIKGEISDQDIINAIDKIPQRTSATEGFSTYQSLGTDTDSEEEYTWDDPEYDWYS